MRWIRSKKLFRTATIAMLKCNSCDAFDALVDSPVRALATGGAAPTVVHVVRGALR
jgi:hypothetical protein